MFLVEPLVYTCLNAFTEVGLRSTGMERSLLFGRKNHTRGICRRRETLINLDEIGTTCGGLRRASASVTVLASRFTVLSTLCWINYSVTWTPQAAQPLLSIPRAKPLRGQRHLGNGILLRNHFDSTKEVEFRLGFLALRGLNLARCATKTLLKFWPRLEIVVDLWPLNIQP